MSAPRRAIPFAIVAALAAFAPLLVAASCQSTSQTASTLPPDYETLRGCEKQALIWDGKISPTRYPPGALPPFTSADGLGLLLAGMRTKMETRGDEMPGDWKKVIHRYGSVAKVKFTAAQGTPFTGLFHGADCGLLRLSLTSAPGKAKFNPGFALKLFVDGKPSANVSALVSLDGQGEDFNFFAREFTNMVPPSDALGLKIAAATFRRASKHPHKISVREFSTVRQDGSLETSPHGPVQLYFVPADGMRMPSSPPRDVREDFARIPAGSTLFHIHAVNEPNPDALTAEEIDANLGNTEHRKKAVHVGDLETTSEFLASAYGDDGLFFRHEAFRGE